MRAKMTKQIKQMSRAVGVKDRGWITLEDLCPSSTHPWDTYSFRDVSTRSVRYSTSTTLWFKASVRTWTKLLNDSNLYHPSPSTCSLHRAKFGSVTASHIHMTGKRLGTTLCLHHGVANDMTEQCSFSQSALEARGSKLPGT